jgi:hypothetical protein
MRDGRWSARPDPQGRARGRLTAIGRYVARSVGPGSSTVPTPEEVLGASHPLARALDLVGVLRRQATATGPAVVASAVGAVIGVDWARPALVASVAVVFVLAVGLALAVSATRECARDLVIEGSEVDLAVVACQRRRLLSQRQREMLADSLEGLVRWAERADREIGTSPPVCDSHVIRQTGRDLLALASDLRSATIGVRGVARTQRLLTSGTSPLFGTEVDELRGELARIRADVVSGAPRADKPSGREDDHEAPWETADLGVARLRLVESAPYRVAVSTRSRIPSV